MLRHARAETPHPELTAPDAAVYDQAHATPYVEAHPFKSAPARVVGDLDPTPYDQELAFLYLSSNPVRVHGVFPWNVSPVALFDVEREDEYTNPTWVTFDPALGVLEPTIFDQESPTNYMQKAPDTNLRHKDGEIRFFPSYPEFWDPDPSTPYSA